jgi:putative resolvase
MQYFICMHETNNTNYWASTKQACQFFGISPNTIRRWADNNKINFKRKPSNQRVYYIPKSDNSFNKISGKQKTYYNDTTILTNFIYCRVSSSKQKDDLSRQCSFLSSKYTDYTIVKDIASGLNYKRPGLLYMLEQSFKGRVGTIVVYSKDRLCRFGYELLEWIFLQNNTKLVVYEQIDKIPEQEFTEDILAILQVFACRWNGKRKYKRDDTAIEKNQN